MFFLVGFCFGFSLFGLHWKVYSAPSPSILDFLGFPGFLFYCWKVSGELQPHLTFPFWICGLCFSCLSHCFSFFWIPVWIAGNTIFLAITGLLVVSVMVLILGFIATILEKSLFHTSLSEVLLCLVFLFA